MYGVKKISLTLRSWLQPNSAIHSDDICQYYIPNSKFASSTCTPPGLKSMLPCQSQEIAGIKLFIRQLVNQPCKVQKQLSCSQKNGQIVKKSI